MGQNLARNLANNDFRVAVYNRSPEKAETFIGAFGTENLSHQKTLGELVASLELPRKLLLMVKAGDPVDAVIKQLTPLLDKGDIVIDGGNSNFRDTIRRTKELQEKELHFVGMGVSGGEEGALKGPSLMPGGSEASWQTLQPILEKIAARDFSGGPCVTHIGEGGAGHYVKMVHNGIEYGVMQLMAEAYFFLKKKYDLEPLSLAHIFKQFGTGKLKSFLFDISVPILEQKDEFNGGYLIDYILDKAGQKGTGRWTAIDALERGVSLPSLTMAVFARNISSQKALRQTLSAFYEKSNESESIELEAIIPQIENALYAGMLSCYAQGFELMKKAAEEEGWDLNFAEISRIWEGGCIIRADLLNFLHKAFESAGEKSLHLFSIPEVKQALEECLNDWRNVVSLATQSGTPTPSLATSLTYFEESTIANGSANFIQGLRDYFGAHTYERTDREGVFHTNWTSSIEN